MLANRLRKSVVRTRRWARKAGVACYRLYDRDIPEVPLCIDWYAGRLHVAEYARGKYEALPPEEHRAWLDTLVGAAAAELGVAPEAVFVKRRERQQGPRQYGRVAEEKARFVVEEGGHQFWVNLSDYLDTGLFLDHRPLRARVQAEAAGAHFLNLFCYTGAFTVYAAAGGAAFTASVDLSVRYLDWARENLTLNRFELDPKQHRLVRTDVLEFIHDGARDREQYDLVVIDPPTFSNSKKMAGAFDIQKEHAGMIERVLQFTAPQGVIYFSSNFRQFRFDLAGVAGMGAEVGEITAETIPPDFRDGKIHRCWRIVKVG